jgi:AcrR family transcriptional regulator
VAANSPQGRRGSLRTEQKQLTRARLLEAARDLFATHGYAALRVDDITAAVGCSRATFYLHFPGKLELLRELSTDGSTPTPLRCYEDLDRVLDTGSRAEFTRWVHRAIDWFTENRLLLAAWDEAAAVEPEFREMTRAGILALPNAMPSYLARFPPERQDEARLRIELLVTQLERFFTRWAMLGTIDVSAEQAARVLTDIWFPALVGADIQA